MSLLYVDEYMFQVYQMLHSQQSRSGDRMSEFHVPTSFGSLAPPEATRNKKLLGTKGIATRSKDTILGAPGLTTGNKKLLRVYRFEMVWI